MNMANMDMRGAIRGTVRGASNAPVADTAVTAVEAANGARFEAMSDAGSIPGLATRSAKVVEPAVTPQPASSPA